VKTGPKRAGLSFFNEGPVYSEQIRINCDPPAEAKWSIGKKDLLFDSHTGR
jgi:hypothetical protein